MATSMELAPKLDGSTRGIIAGTTSIRRGHWIALSLELIPWAVNL